MCHTMPKDAVKRFLKRLRSHSNSKLDPRNDTRKGKKNGTPAIRAHATHACASLASKCKPQKRLARSRVSLSEKATMQSKFVSKNEAHRAQGPVASREGCRWCRHMLARDGYGYMTTDPAREKVPGGQGL